MPTQPLLVIYLDFDGVLHSDEVYWAPGRPIRCLEGRLFEHLPVLQGILAETPQVSIVLSTSWVQARGYSYAKKQLGALAQRVIGATFHSSHHDRQQFLAASRGIQIWGDVCRRAPAGWVAVDDDGFGWPVWCREHLIETDGGRGLGDAATAAHLRAALKRMIEGALSR